jgi:hypothetical protein
MKFIIIALLIIISVNKTFAQLSPAEQLSQKIATRLQDSLNLTSAQKDSIYAINNRIYEQKVQCRKQYVDSGKYLLTHCIQITENSRDSLYKAVLSPEQMELYNQKKRNLIGN